MHVSHGALIILAGGALWTAACSLDSTGPTTVRCNQLGSISVGDTLRDTLDTSSCRLADNTYANYYQFTVTDSQAQLLATLSSPAATAFLHVSDTTGFLLANSSISQVADTSATLHLFLRQGTYYLGVNSYAIAPSGPFRLRIARDSTPVRGCTETWVTPGISTAQTVTIADCTVGPSGPKYFTHLYLLVARSSQRLTMTEHSTAFSPLLQIISYTGQGTLVGQSVLDSTNTSGVVQYTPPAEDLLLLYVGTSDSLETGAYSLKVN